MQDFLKNIDNKEIFIEVLHHSIDYLIEKRDNQHTIRMCHKYGFQNPDEFVSATRSLSNYFKNCCMDNNSCRGQDLNTEFADLSPSLRSMIPQVFSARRPEIIKYLMRWHLAFDQPAVESFDWDTRIIMGDSSFPLNIHQVTTLIMHCRKPNSKKIDLLCQMNKDMLGELIAVLENAIKDDKSIK